MSTRQHQSVGVLDSDLGDASDVSNLYTDNQHTDSQHGTIREAVLTCAQRLTRVRLVYCMEHTHTHTHTFNGPLSGTTRVSRYQKGKTNLDFIEARDSEWQWHQLGHVQVCTMLQTDDHANTPPFSFYRPDALPAAQPTASKALKANLLHGTKKVGEKKN